MTHDPVPPRNPRSAIATEMAAHRAVRAVRPVEQRARGYVAGVTTFTGTRQAAESRASPRASPRALIVTIYGLYARNQAGDAGGWLSVAALIRLMGALDADQ